MHRCGTGNGTAPLAESVPRAHHAEDAEQDPGTLRDLVRLRRDEPGLRAVWLEAHYDAEAESVAMIADRTGDDLAVRVEAGVLSTALRIAVEDWALRPDPTAGPPLGDTVTAALRLVTHVGRRGRRPRHRNRPAA
ncbi:hypothetical protein [Streptomyces sp. NEAU-W12]|uniref:hypothetical protein n=1 Tax=Streptomyces sp. NEAU-W12 TaxID=2994668 RepID=UPI00224AE409|nr:hypothetical protein [Streptomyces sp. NEAU-W12]MCX2924054.1 hypothetical protein [Streptomyces sp. NEAU-W12]